jgi:hypothetical protein
MAFKNALAEAARYLGLKIPGKRNATYTKHFERGVICQVPALLGIQKDEVQGERVYVPADGVRGSGKRVYRTFPVIPSWECTVIFEVLDDVISPEVFLRVLKECGLFIGLGRFRPKRNGYYGRFVVDNLGIETTEL